MKKQDWFLLLLVIFVLIYYHNNKTSNIIINPEPTPVVPVTPEPIPVPKVTKTVYEKALEKAVQSNKKLLVLFTADWCGHCRSLKKDLPDMDTSDFEICELDIDEKINKDLKDRFSIKMIPCSIIIDPKLDQEIKRKCGYIPNEYKMWLKG